MVSPGPSTLMSGSQLVVREGCANEQEAEHGQDRSGDSHDASDDEAPSTATPQPDRSHPIQTPTADSCSPGLFGGNLKAGNIPRPTSVALMTSIAATAIRSSLIDRASSHVVWPRCLVHKTRPLARCYRQTPPPRPPRGFGQSSTRVISGRGSGRNRRDLAASYSLSRGSVRQIGLFGPRVVTFITGADPWPQPRVGLGQLFTGGMKGRTSRLDAADLMATLYAVTRFRPTRPNSSRSGAQF